MGFSVLQDEKRRHGSESREQRDWRGSGGDQRDDRERAERDKHRERRHREQEDPERSHRDRTGTNKSASDQSHSHEAKTAETKVNAVIFTRAFIDFMDFSNCVCPFCECREYYLSLGQVV